MDHTFYKFNIIKMKNIEEARAIMNMIIHLKSQPNTVETKKTIQSLQQQLGGLNSNDSK